MAGYAADKGLDIFYPRLRVNPVNPRASKIKPFFPGYMFVHADIEAQGMGAFMWMPHSLGLVCFGGLPGKVPDSVINGLRQMVDASQTVDDVSFKGLKRGDRVRVVSGPLSGYEGIFEVGLSGGDRVKVLLTLLHDNFKTVELNVTQVTPGD